MPEPYRPPAGVRNAARRALGWIADGKAGDGFTATGRARARQLADGDPVSRETIGRMANYFGRHASDRDATGFNSGEDGFPSPGRVAWDAWGGDPGRSWANRILNEERSKMTLHSPVERYVPLDDMTVRSEGGERIIDAYAAAFNVRQEIRDGEGHYMEEISSSAFDRTLEQRGGRLQVIFNHGKSMYGTPSERFSMPYGTPVEVRPDGRGLFTSTKVAKTELGDEVLELAQSGALRGQSFGGHFVTTSTSSEMVDGLKLKVRTEIALREYGLTPFPYYQEAVLVGVRAEAAEMIASLTTDEIVQHLMELPEQARSELTEALASALADPGTGTVDPADPGTVDATTHITPGARAAKLRALTLRGIR